MVQSIDMHYYPYKDLEGIKKHIVKNRQFKGPRD